MFTLLLELSVMCGQRWIQFELPNNLNRSFAIDGKIYTITARSDDSSFAFVQPLQAAHPAINILIRATLYVQRVWFTLWTPPQSLIVMDRFDRLPWRFYSSTRFAIPWRWSLEDTLSRVTVYFLHVAVLCLRTGCWGRPSSALHVSNSRNKESCFFCVAALCTIKCKSV